MEFDVFSCFFFEWRFVDDQTFMCFFCDGYLIFPSRQDVHFFLLAIIWFFPTLVNQEMKPDKNNEKKNNSGGNQTWFAGKSPIYIYFDDF